MRKLYWYITTYFKKHGWILILSIFIALIIFSLSISTLAQKFEIRKKRYIGIIGKYSLSSLPLVIQEKLSAGLTKIEEDNTVSSYLAERWTVEDGGKTYRFVIKQGITWQDGTTLKPSDLNLTFPDVETIYTPNDVVFKLPDEYVPFHIVVSKPVFKEAQKKYWFFFTKPILIGIGEYKMENYKLDHQKLTELILDNNQEKLIYRFYFTQDEAIRAFKLGKVDELNDLSNPDSLLNWPNLKITTVKHPERYLAIFFNNANPKFSKNVRQALSYATTKPSGEDRAIGPINPKSWAYLEAGKTYDLDQDRAKERLLDEIPQQPLNFELTTTDTFVKEAEKIKSEWEQFGQTAFQACLQKTEIKDKDLCANTKIQVNIKITNFPDTANFEILLIGQEIPSDPDQYHLWHSKQSTNFTKYQNTRIDALLEKGRKTAEKNERKTIYQEFQQFLLEDAPAIFIRHLESYNIKRQ